jgi:hypothetical protein
MTRKYAVAMPVMRGGWTFRQRAALLALGRGHVILQTEDGVIFDHGLRVYATTLRSLAVAKAITTPALPLGEFRWPQDGAVWAWRRAPVDTEVLPSDLPSPIRREDV